MGSDRDLAVRLVPFAEQPSRSVVILDFDGSLAPIVADPPEAAPLPGAVEVLARLVQRVGRVAVVSGRPVEFLRSVLPVEGLMLVGQYGVECLDGTAVVTDPRVHRWEAAVEAAAAEAEASLPWSRRPSSSGTLISRWRGRAVSWPCSTAWRPPSARKNRCNAV